jgi:hypothetical protein
MGEERGAYRLLVGKPEENGQLGRPRSCQMDTIKMDLADMKWCDVDWIDLAQDRDMWRPG